jgi:hypothetical protein
MAKNWERYDQIHFHTSILSLVLWGPVWSGFLPISGCNWDQTSYIHIYIMVEPWLDQHRPLSVKYHARLGVWLEFQAESEGLMKRTWLRLVRSCTLQIVWCPNFKTEEGRLEQSSEENCERGRGVPREVRRWELKMNEGTWVWLGQYLNWIIQVESSSLYTK